MKTESTKHDVYRKKSSLTDQRDLVSRVRLEWHRDQQPDAVNFLAEHPTIRKNRPLAIELAYEEYCIRRDAGESISRSTFCNRFPTISRSLSRQIEVDEYVRQHSATVVERADIRWPCPGDRLFQLVVVEEIGRGAFARVYLCVQPAIGNRQVVVKVSRGGAVEANMMGGLDHANIMSVLSVQEDSTTKLTGICMPFVGRSTLFDVIDVAFGREPVPTRAGVILEAARALTSRGDRYHRTTSHVKIRVRSAYVTGVLQLSLQLAEALVHAHEHGVLHGDLKPSNVVMSVTGIPMLVDFNLSQSRDSANFLAGGTLPYMAPEKIRLLLLGPDAEDFVDHRADLFSLGAIMYELLVGRPPFLISGDERDPCAMAVRMLEAQKLRFESIRKLNPTVDARPAALVGRCLAFEVHERPESIQRVVDELRRYLSVPNRVRRFSRHPRRQLLIGGGLFASLGLAITGRLMLSSSPNRRAFASGVAAYHKGDYVTATQRFNEAIAADPEDASLYLARGCTALRQFEVDQFQARLDAAHRDLTLAGRYTSNANVDVVKAYCAMKYHDFDAARVLLESKLNKEAGTYDLWNNLGYCYVKLRVQSLGRRQRSEELFGLAHGAFKRAVELKPDAIVPHCNVACLELVRYQNQNRDVEFLPTDGLEHTRCAIRLGADDTRTYVFGAKIAFVLAKVSNDGNLLQEGFQYLKNAVERGYAVTVTSDLEQVSIDPRFEAIRDIVPSQNRPTARTLIIPPAVMDSNFGLDSKTTH